jgi:hypothetical protein
LGTGLERLRVWGDDEIVNRSDPNEKRLGIDLCEITCLATGKTQFLDGSTEPRGQGDIDNGRIIREDTGQTSCTNSKRRDL